MELPKIYYCKRCDRYTDVRYISDKKGGRYKSYCYKCGDEMLEPVEVTNGEICFLNYLIEYPELCQEKCKERKEELNSLFKPKMK